jgi:superfamily I DNA/RNA helicase
LVLVHRQKIGEMLRQRLGDLGVPAHSFFSQEAVTKDEAKRALAVLRLAVSEDPVSLRVILGVGDATARAPAYKRLRDFAAASGRSDYEILGALAAGEHLPLRVSALVSRYRSALAEAAALPQDDVTTAIDQLLPDGVAELADLRTIALEEAIDADGLAALCEKIITRVTQHEIPESPAFVRIMSLHKSKGLTSPVVVLAGMVDGIVPTIKATSTEREEAAARDEQRRLVYVALTRAKDELIISSCARIEFGMASALGVRVVREGIRPVSGRLMAPTIASPYLQEIARSAPNARRGVDWLAAN